MINKIRRAIVMSDDDFIKPQDLEIEIGGAAEEKEDTLKEVRREIEKQKIKEVLEICSNNISKAARMLDISRPNLYYLKKKYKL